MGISQFLVYFFTFSYAHRTVRYNDTADIWRKKGERMDYQLSHLSLKGIPRSDKAEKRIKLFLSRKKFFLFVGKGRVFHEKGDYSSAKSTKANSGKMWKEGGGENFPLRLSSSTLFSSNLECTSFPIVWKWNLGHLSVCVRGQFNFRPAGFGSLSVYKRGVAAAGTAAGGKTPIKMGDPTVTSLWVAC